MSALNPRWKLLLAVGAVGAIALLSAASDGGTTRVARLLLGIASIAGIGFFFAKGRSATRFALEPRMSIVSRAGLSQRAGVALVEVDGAPFLIVHGDGYAQVHPTRTPASAPMLLTEAP